MTTKSPRQAGDRLPLPLLLVLSAVGFTAITTELLPSGLLPLISRGLSVSESRAGLLTAAYAAVIVISVVPVTILAAKVPRKVLLVGVIVIFALSNSLTAVSPVFAVALISRLLGGMAHGLLWSTMAPFVARVVPAHSMGRAMAIVFAGNSLGLAVGAPAGTLLGAALGWRVSFLLLAAVLALLAVVAFALIPKVATPKDAPRASFRRGAAQPGVKAIAVAWPMLLLAHFALFTYVAPFLRSVGLPEEHIGLALSVVGAAGLVGIWIAGLNVDTHPRRALLTTVAVLVASLALLPFIGQTAIGCWILLGLWGAALGAIGIYNQAAILKAGGKHRDAANGLTVLTIQIGITLGSLYGAFALVTLGATLVPLAAAVAAAVALAIVAVGRKSAYPAGPREQRRRRGTTPASSAEPATQPSASQLPQAGTTDTGATDTKATDTGSSAAGIDSDVAGDEDILERQSQSKR